MEGVPAMTPPLPTVAICIATYMRPDYLQQLLRSVLALEFHGAGNTPPHIIVVDNDVNGSAEEVVRAFRDNTRWPVTYRIETGKGISYARNRLVQLASDCEYLAFVDDDEQVASDWLHQLLAMQQTCDADVVAGPVVPKYASPPARWILRGQFFDRSRRSTGTPVKYVATNNVLIRRGVLGDVDGPFDHRFALTGGEDTFLFLQLHAAGATMVWCDEAVVTESIGSDRLCLRWIIRRSYRVGNTLARCEQLLGYGRAAKMRRFGKGAGWLLYGSAGVLLSLLNGRAHAARRIANMARGLGMIAGLFNYTYEEYGRHPSPESAHGH